MRAKKKKKQFVRNLLPALSIPIFGRGDYDARTCRRDLAGTTRFLEIRITLELLLLWCKAQSFGPRLALETPQLGGMHKNYPVIISKGLSFCNLQCSVRQARPGNSLWSVVQQTPALPILSSTRLSRGNKKKLVLVGKVVLSVCLCAYLLLLLYGCVCP